MEPGEQKYGVPDIVYDIIQTVGNLLQGEEKLIEYARDAENAGDAGRGDGVSHGGRREPGRRADAAETAAGAFERDVDCILGRLA